MNLFMLTITLLIIIPGTSSEKEFDQVSPSQSDEQGENECNLLDGMRGQCRPTRTCMRQRPQQLKWNACQWDDNRRAPSKVCCLSEEEFTEKLLKETNSIRVSEDEPDEEEEDDDQEYNQPKCGFSRVVSHQMPFNMSKKRRSKAEIEVYDRLFPAAYRIVMGSRVRVGQIPWMCSIYYLNNFVCGGSLIDHKHIVTAAHCFESSSNPDDYHVRLGSVMVFNGTVVTIDQIWVHENYQPPRIYHDIALVRLEEPAVFSDEVAPICLPKMSWLTKDKLIGKVAFVSGFGDTRFGGPQAPSLRETDLKILNNSFCNENFQNLIESRMKFPVGMRASIVCAGHEQGGKDACQGDSGGPLTAVVVGVNYLIGIVSFGYKCAMPRFPGVYSSVPYYLDWIREKILS